MAEYTGIGQGIYNTVAGSVGLASALTGNGGLGGLFGGNNGVSKETFDLSQELSSSKSANAILTAELGNEKKMVEIYNALYRNERDLEQRMEKGFAEQALINCQLSNRIGILETKVDQLMAMTKLGIRNDALWPAPTT